jgi:hypothetical protein
MSHILYYSTFCNHSNNLLKHLSKSKISEQIHFINIDNRVRENNKTYIILQNNEKIILPDIINRVPALMNLSDYSVVFSEDDILRSLSHKQVEITKVATNNNFEPTAFSFGGGNNSGIISDNFCFLDTPPEELAATGNGGIRQLHQYFKYDQMDEITTNQQDDNNGTKNSKLPSSLTIEQLQKKRMEELK